MCNKNNHFFKVKIYNFVAQMIIDDCVYKCIVCGLKKTKDKPCLDNYQLVYFYFLKLLY